MTRRTSLVTGLVALAVALSGCSPVQSVLGLQQNTAVLSGRPVLTPAQATTIASRALTQAQRADAVQTPEAADAAFTGLALRVAAPTYLVNRALAPAGEKSGKALAPVVTPSRIVVTAGSRFPRSLVVLWTPQGAATQQIAVLSSPDVRSQFRVSARADLLPGVALPATPPNARGASLLAADVDGLVATPKKAVSDLATLLQTGKSGATDFAASVVVKDVRANAAAQANGVSKVASFSQEHRPEAESPYVIRMADGGALVVAAIDRYDRFVVKKGAGSIKPPAAYTALASGLTKITRMATVKTVQVVVLTLPAQGKGRAQVIGFSEMPVAVQGS